MVKDEVADGFCVRLSRPADAVDVGALLRVSYPVLMAEAYPPEVLRWALPSMTRANPELLASGRYFVAVAGGALVGCGGWSWQRPGSGELEPGLGHLRHFATHPAWLRHGVGRAIYRRSETQALDEGACQFECFASVNAEPFYRALGFHRVRMGEIAHGDAWRMACVLMRRALSPAAVAADHRNAAGTEPG